jgi:hypothetical protein
MDINKSILTLVFVFTNLFFFFSNICPQSSSKYRSFWIVDIGLIYIYIYIYSEYLYIHNMGSLDNNEENTLLSHSLWQDMAWILNFF